MWEYKIVTLTGDKEADLNSLGADGWELVSVLSETKKYYPTAFFKRPLPVKQETTSDDATAE